MTFRKSLLILVVLLASVPAILAQQPSRPACEKYKMRVITPDGQLDQKMERQLQTEMDYKGIVIAPCQPDSQQATAPGKMKTTSERLPAHVPIHPLIPKSNNLFAPSEMFRRAQQRTDKPKTP